MDEQPPISNAKAKFEQNRNLALLIAGLILFLLIVGSYCFIKIKSSQTSRNSNQETVKMSALSEDINDSSIALQRLEKRIEEYEKKSNQSNPYIESSPNNESTLYLEEKLREIEEKIQNLESNNEEAYAKTTNQEDKPLAVEERIFPRMPTFNEQENDLQPLSNESAPIPASIIVDSFKGVEAKPKKAANYIPAGTFVKALLVQGIDASASISSQGDPRPILMRLVSNGSLPNEVRTHIEDCRLIGAAYGDVSSERAFIRLESVSCTLKSKDILENTVDGYVVGEDGKAGVRGVIVRREKDLLKNSFLSGLASGFGSGLSDSFNRDLVSPFGVVTQTNSSDVFKKGAAEGVGNAFDRLSKYYIDRAEQFQPVIQVAAGREVDVVFKKGFYLQEGSQPLQLAQDEVIQK